MNIYKLVTNGNPNAQAWTVETSDIPEILSGSTLFVEPGPAQLGDMVVVRAACGVCVKYYQPRRTGIYLVSSNKDYEARPIDEDFRIIGVVTGWYTPRSALGQAVSRIAGRS